MTRWIKPLDYLKLEKMEREGIIAYEHTFHSSNIVSLK